jgi:hypothetical protein
MLVSMAATQQLQRLVYWLVVSRMKTEVALKDKKAIFQIRLVLKDGMKMELMALLSNAVSENAQMELLVKAMT